MIRRLQKDLQDVRDNPPQDCAAWPDNDDDMFDVTASIGGPEGSPYEGGVFYLKLKFTYSYPVKPPKANFTTRIYNPYVYDEGSINLYDIYHYWSPSLSLSDILLTIRGFMINPHFPAPPSYSVVTYEHELNSSLFESTARKWTRLYAY